MRHVSIADVVTGRFPLPGREHPRLVSELMQARDLPRFALADAAPDVRGWHVIAADRTSVGTVSRLIVEMRTGAVRYLMVTLDPRLERRARRVFASSVLVPVGLARRVDDLCTVLLDHITRDMLQSAPRIPDRPITRLDEEITLEHFGLPALDSHPDSVYAAEHFSLSALFKRPTE
ncbi:MAG TPA: PRC-barrel domain-containing protein [Gemmatimonadaceae bacterium]|nr:PRC-barrel domain-containing protein [Gemmatimonadaceae bacterium]